MQDLNDMMVFLHVVETGSFTAAAERLGIPKANISRKVSRLEQTLGVVLLERSTRSQHLTEAGRLYLNHCKRIHEEMDLASAAVSEVLHSLKGHLKLGASVAIGQQVLKPVLADFMHQYPHIDLHLNLTNDRVDLIEGGFDLLIRIGKLDDSRLIAKRLGQASRHLYASKRYFNNRPIPDNTEQLQHCDLLFMKQYHPHHTLELISNTNTFKLNCQPRLITDDFMIMKQAVLDGVGIAVLPDYMCKEAMSSGEMIQILPEWEMPAVDIYALYPQHRAKIPKVSVLIDFIQKVFHQALTIAVKP